MKYEDFDLQIEPAGEKYRVRLLNAPTGQATTEFALPFTDIEVSNFLSRIGQVRLSMRRVDAPELQAAKEFGGRLFSAIFSGEMIAQLRGSMEQAADKECGLRIRLRLTDVPALADLPWEFLYDANQNHFLTTSSETPLVRFLDLPQRISPLRVTLPLRVLVVISSPRNLKRLDAEGEWERLRDALGDLSSSGQIVLERLPSATLDALRLRARGAPFHIFHFIGHGGFDNAAQDGVLQFEDEMGMSYPVRGELLGMQLHDHRSLRLAVLNACEGARSSRQDPFSGVAQSLLQQRVPAVIAMQFEISDAAAKVFALEFYRAVAEGNPVDAAVCESRKALFKEEFGQEWATPVLYMRSQEGQLFELQAVAAPPLPDANLEKRERAETERQATEKAEAGRQPAEKTKAENAARAERERQERERAEHERVVREKVEAERQAVEKAEAARQALAKVEAERAARAENERLGQEAAGRARLAREKEQPERRARERAEYERLQSQHAEAERLAREKAAAEGLSPQRQEHEQTRQVLSLRSWLLLAALPVLGLGLWLVHNYVLHTLISENPELHYKTGETLRGQNNFQGAMAEYRQAIGLRPDYVAAHFGLGIALRDSGDLENAVTEFRKVIRLRPTDSGGHDALGLTLFRKGDLDGAAVEYREAIKLDSQNAEAHYNLAKALNKKGDNDGSIAEYRETVRLKPDFGETHLIPELPSVEKNEKGGAPDASASRPVTSKHPSEKHAPTRIRQGGNVQAAKLIRRVTPTYPPLAVQSRVSDTVRLHAIIARDGTVKEVDVISGHPLLLQSAVSAVKQWRYAPTLLNGQPVEVDTTVNVEYTLTSNSSITPKSTPGSDAATTANSTASATLPPANKAPCTFGKIDFTEQGNILVGSVPYTYQGSYPLDTVAIRGIALKQDKQPVSGLTYAQSTLKTATGIASFSIEGHPSLDHQGEKSEYLLIAIVVKQTGSILCSQTVSYQRKW
jgi:TonB family protein